MGRTAFCVDQFLLEFAKAFLLMYWEFHMYDNCGSLIDIELISLGRENSTSVWMLIIHSNNVCFFLSIIFSDA